MEKTRKQLKEISVVILILAAFSLIRSVIDVILTDFSQASRLEGVTPGLILATQIFLIVFAFVLMIPEIYVGVKGIKIANASSSSKAPIVWAVILAIFSGVGVISSVSSLIHQGDLVGDLLALANTVVDVLLYITYINHVKKLIQ